MAKRVASFLTKRLLRHLLSVNHQKYTVVVEQAHFTNYRRVHKTPPVQSSALNCRLGLLMSVLRDWLSVHRLLMAAVARQQTKTWTVTLYTYKRTQNTPYCNTYYTVYYLILNFQVGWCLVEGFKPIERKHHIIRFSFIIRTLNSIKVV